MWIGLRAAVVEVLSCLCLVTRSFLFSLKVASALETRDIQQDLSAADTFTLSGWVAHRLWLLCVFVAQSWPSLPRRVSPKFRIQELFWNTSVGISDHMTCPG